MFFYCYHNDICGFILNIQVGEIFSTYAIMDITTIKKFDLDEAKKAFLDLYGKLDIESKSEFLDWIQDPASKQVR
jgi:hypothetical protein